MKTLKIKIINNTKDDIILNLKLLLIWGAGIGGIMHPISQYLETGKTQLNTFEVVSFLCATLTIIVDENLKNIKKILPTIKKGKLRNPLCNFLHTINITIYNLIIIIGYAFIIPILTILWNISQYGIKQNEIKEIFLRLFAFGIATIIGNILKELFTELFENIKN